MKRGGPGHPKMADLARRLELPKWGAVGVMESLWHFAYAYAPRGDIGRHTDAYIATGIDWKGDATALIDALVGANLVDRCPCHRLRIHDWPGNLDQTGHRKYEVIEHGLLECYPPQPASKKQAAAASKKLAGNTSSGDAVVPPPPVEASGASGAVDASQVLAFPASNPPAADASNLLANPASPPLPVPLPLPVPVPLPDGQTGEPTPATPAEARAVALERLGPRGTPNPLVGTRRSALEVEWLQLVRKIAERTGEHPEDVAPKWNGKPRLNPADPSMSDDRLLRDLADLRNRWASLLPRPAAAAQATTLALPTLPDDVVAQETAAREERKRESFRRLREVLNAEGGIGAAGGAEETGPDPSGGGGGGDGSPAGDGDGTGVAPVPAAPAAVLERAPVQRPDGAATAASPGDGRHRFVRGVIRTRGTRVPLCDECERPEDDAAKHFPQDIAAEVHA